MLVVVVAVVTLGFFVGLVNALTVISHKPKPIKKIKIQRQTIEVEKKRPTIYMDIPAGHYSKKVAQDLEDLLDPINFNPFDRR